MKQKGYDPWVARRLTVRSHYPSLQLFFFVLVLKLRTPSLGEKKKKGPTNSTQHTKDFVDVRLDPIFMEWWAGPAIRGVVPAAMLRECKVVVASARRGGWGDIWQIYGTAWETGKRGRRVHELAYRWVFNLRVMVQKDWKLMKMVYLFLLCCRRCAWVAYGMKRRTFLEESKEKERIAKQKEAKGRILKRSASANGFVEDRARLPFPALWSLFYALLSFYDYYTFHLFIMSRFL